MAIEGKQAKNGGGRWLLSGILLQDRGRREHEMLGSESGLSKGRRAEDFRVLIFSHFFLFFDFLSFLTFFSFSICF